MATKKATAPAVATPNMLEPNQRFIRQLQRMKPKNRALAAEAMQKQLAQLQAQIARARCSGVREMRAEGLTLAAIATILDVSITRVKQIEDGANGG